LRQHLHRALDRPGAVIDARKQVGVHVDHKRRTGGQADRRTAPHLPTFSSRIIVTLPEFQNPTLPLILAQM
jgi:hypothetical protein